MSPSFDLEQSIGGAVIGIDEVGRGPLAGPVVAAAVLFRTLNIPPNVLSLIKDSKKLSPKQRQNAISSLNPFVIVGIGAASTNIIDNINILQSSMLCMQRAAQKIMQSYNVQHALIDGNKCPDLPCPASAIVKGDGLSFSIAAASIYAKEMRDLIMTKLSRRYPYFLWQNNSGYGTSEHLHGMNNYGISPHHRKSFKPVSTIISHKNNQ